MMCCTPTAIRGIIANDDELEDDEYCEKMVEEYLKRKGHETIPFVQALQEAGLRIEDLQD